MTATDWMAEFRRTSLETWNATAPGWERQHEGVEDTAEAIRAWMLRELAPEPGQTLLELAAGAGITGLEAARLVGPEGRLISTDFSPAMVEVARRRGEERGLANVEYRVLDAEHMDLEDDSVDGVLCRFGYMLMADPAAAFAETRRVLRPGGRVVLAVWGRPEQNPVFAILGRILVQGGHMPPPEPGRPGQFSLGDEERLRSLLDGAGFGTVRIEPLPARFAFTDLTDYLELVADASAAIARVLSALSEDERRAVESQLAGAFEPFRGDAGYEFRGVAIGAVAS